MQMARTVKKEPFYLGELSGSESPFSQDIFPLSDLETFKDIFSGNMDETQLFANFKEEELFDYRSEAGDIGLFPTDMGFELKDESSFEYQSDSNDVISSYNPYDSCDNADNYEFHADSIKQEYDSCDDYDVHGSVHNYGNFNSKSNNCSKYDGYGAYAPDHYESGHESTDSEVTLRLTPIVGGKSCPEALSKYQKRVYHEKAQHNHLRHVRQESPRQTATRSERLPKKDNLIRKKESEIYVELTKVLMGLQKAKPELQLFDTKLKSRQPSRLVTMQACGKLFNTHLISASKTRKKAMIMRQKFINELTGMSAQNVDLKRAIELKISQCETIIRETSRVQ